MGGGGGGTSICWWHGDVPPVRVYCFANFPYLCFLKYTFQPHSKLCSLRVSQGSLIVFYVLSGSGSGSPGGTTPSILVPDLGL